MNRFRFTFGALVVFKLVAQCFSFDCSGSLLNLAKIEKALKPRFTESFLNIILKQMTSSANNIEFDLTCLKKKEVVQYWSDCSNCRDDVELFGRDEKQNLT